MEREEMLKRKATVPPSFVHGRYRPCIGLQCGEILSNILADSYYASLNCRSDLYKILAVSLCAFSSVDIVQYTSSTLR
jgi:hypothetical protein